MRLGTLLGAAVFGLALGVPAAYADDLTIAVAGRERRYGLAEATAPDAIVGLVDDSAAVEVAGQDGQLRSRNLPHKRGRCRVQPVGRGDRHLVRRV